MTDFLKEYNLTGAAIGLCTFLIIGLFHPLVIKGEYYIGRSAKWIFLVLGLIALAACLSVKEIIWQTLLGVVAFSSFWSIKEIDEQVERVRKGWFPANPKRIDKDTRKSE